MSRDGALDGIAREMGSRRWKRATAGALEVMSEWGLRPGEPFELECGALLAVGTKPRAARRGRAR